MDIRKYFDNIDHQMLMSLIKRRINDLKVLKMLERWLKAGVIENNKKSDLGDAIVRKRKIFVLSLIIIVSILGVVTGCSKQNRIEDLKLGSYVMQDTKPEDWSWVLLKENSQFEFNRSMNTSYRPRGTYSIEDGLLILYVSEEESYVFSIERDKLVFIRGDFISNLVKEGAIFKFSD